MGFERVVYDELPTCNYCVIFQTGTMLLVFVTQVATTLSFAYSNCNYQGTFTRNMLNDQALKKTHSFCPVGKMRLANFGLVPSRSNDWARQSDMHLQLLW